MYKHAVCTEHAECTEQAVSTEHAVRTEHAVCTEHTVYKSCSLQTIQSVDHTACRPFVL